MSKNDYDFMTHSGCLQQPGLPIVMPQHGESEAQKFERYIRQISRCTQACSLCPLGQKFHEFNNVFRDPHVTPSLQHSKIAFVKFKPSVSDLEHYLFSELKDVFKKVDLNFNSVYKTSMVKCIGDGHDCPYFELEMKALRPSLVIYTDKECADIEEMKFQQIELFGFKTKVILARTTASQKSLIKLIKAAEADPQVRNHLLS